MSALGSNAWTSWIPSGLTALFDLFGSDLSGVLASGVGRTGLTKMNSTQVFTGMPPIKINATLLFRAWKNPKLEVEEPFDTFMGWALPQCLQKDSVLTGIVSGSASCVEDGGNTLLTKLLPSKAPQMVRMTYKGRTFKPLVIESVGMPLDSPITVDGYFTELLVPATLSTWQALDAKDWTDIRTLSL